MRDDDQSMLGKLIAKASEFGKRYVVREQLRCPSCDEWIQRGDSSPCGAHKALSDVGPDGLVVRINLTPADPAMQRPMLTAPVKTVPKELHKTREQRITEVMLETTMHIDRKDGGYRRTAAQRAEVQPTDPFSEKVDRFCSSIAYENPSTGLVSDDDERIDPVPKYFIERRD